MASSKNAALMNPELCTGFCEACVFECRVVGDVMLSVYVGTMQRWQAVADLGGVAIER